jgi:hypothetical protein
MFKPYHLSSIPSLPHQFFALRHLVMSQNRELRLQVKVVTLYGMLKSGVVKFEQATLLYMTSQHHLPAGNNNTEML